MSEGSADENDDEAENQDEDKHATKWVVDIVAYALSSSSTCRPVRTIA